MQNDSIVAPTRATEHASSPTSPVVILDGDLTPAQYKTVLETIAGRMATLNNVMMVLQQPGDSWERSVLIDAAQALTVSVGAMADEAIGGQIVGDANRWNFGPNFEEGGAA